ncbi:PH domain-like protein [Ascobolus immersus RN42]|uniref:PH domain-like protein n=1 Tax=Ascobolus immersus RN42 TaxID=1160509 RepID=A0A3N4HJ57_ASCIM|nr:PH domain-like protein [Ascobolus immersus RN42]
MGYSNAIIPADPPSYDDIIAPLSTTGPSTNGESSSTSPQRSTRDSDGGFKLPPPRFKISPRPEEGKEDLPPYTKSIYKQTTLSYKPELSSPFDRALKRNWRSVFVILNGTALYIHKNKSMGLFSPVVFAEQGNLDEEASLGFKAGSLIAKYTLQGAEVGMATDYEKRHFVIRLRAETEQFLISFRKLEHMIEWIESISAAIDLSPSLDERSLPRYQTMPRRLRPAAIQTPAQLVQEQQTIIRSQFPHLASTNSRLPSSLPDVPEENEAPSSEAASTVPRPIGSSAPVTRRRNNRDQKIPLQRVSDQANLRYARRCMAVLCADQPRQSNYVIFRGEWVRIEWEKRKLVRIKTGEEVGGDLPPYSKKDTDEGLA